MPLEEHAQYPCPYCGAENSLHIDYTAGRSQEFVTDCENCCRPITIQLMLSEHGVDALLAFREDE